MAKSIPNREKSKVRTGPPELIARKLQEMISHSSQRPPRQRPKQFLLWVKRKLADLEELYALARTQSAPPEMLSKIAKAIGMAKGEASAAQRRLH